MIKKRYFGFIPTDGVTVEKQLKNCISELTETLKSLNSEFRNILKQTVFIKAENNIEYADIKKRLTQILNESFDSSVPPTGFVGQPPEKNKLVALEVIVAVNQSTDYQIQHKRSGDSRYVIVRNGNFNEVYVAGLTSPDLFAGTGDQANEVFSRMKAILKKEGLNFSDIVRQWNYIENIVGVTSENQDLKQNYQVFNNVRSEYYKTSSFKNGYPAATGIGMNVGGVILDFIAVSSSKNLSVHPIKNPQQVDAHQYSDEVLVGENSAHKTSPKFERAKVLSNQSANEIFISGTAAILGQNIIHQKAIADQTITTIQNINNLISFDNLKANGVSICKNVKAPSYIRIYVKNMGDIPEVRKICNEYFNGVPALYLVSDICRDNLVVEIEGIAEF